MFQFQTGAIKSASAMPQSMAGKSFNSKLVRLKDKHPNAIFIIIVCFNSKLVRLKVSIYLFGGYEHVFQFQTGAIKSQRYQATPDTA